MVGALYKGHTNVITNLTLSLDCYHLLTITSHGERYQALGLRVPADKATGNLNGTKFVPNHFPFRLPVVLASHPTHTH
jgi:hypothetical protein